MPGNDKENSIRKKNNILDSFDYALRGIVYAVKAQRNMRIHFLVAILILLVSSFLDLSRIELSVIILCIAFVLVAEMINTALEYTVNLITEEHHPLAKIIKDTAAGAVLFASICSAVVGYMVFIRPGVMPTIEKQGILDRIAGFPPYFSAIAVFVAFFAAVIIKGFTMKKMSLRGGMPSIHTAVAFSLALMSFILSGSLYVFLCAVIIASLVGQARIAGKIHTFWEVVAGAIVGIFFTLLVFGIVS